MDTTGDQHHAPGGGESVRHDSGDLPFSRNLELKAAGEPAGRKKPEAERAALPLDQEEKQTYFQVEAGKVIDILGEEIERLGRSRETLELVEELFSGWLTLWGEEKNPPVTYFSAMFEVARDVFRQADRLGRKGLTPPERLTMSRLLQGMKGLVQGEGGRQYYDWCRETANRCHRMVAAWATRTEPAGAKDSAAAPAEPAAGLDDGLDISKSVDEWFVQVSRLVKGSAGMGKPTASEAGSGLEGPWQSGIVSAGESEETPVEKVSPAEPEPGLRPAETAGAEGRTLRAGGSLPGAEPSPPAQVPAAVTAGGPSGMEKEPAVESGAEPSEGHLAEAYFVERCLDALELIRNNLDKLAGPSTRKVSHLLDECVGQVAVLAQDFGIDQVDNTLEVLRINLNNIVSATDRGEPTGSAEIEALRSAVSRLERDCQLLDCVA